MSQFRLKLDFRTSSSARYILLDKEKEPCGQLDIHFSIPVARGSLVIEKQVLTREDIIDVQKEINLVIVPLESEYSFEMEIMLYQGGYRGRLIADEIIPPVRERIQDSSGMKYIPSDREHMFDDIINESIIDDDLIDDLLNNKINREGDIDKDKNSWETPDEDDESPYL